MNAPMIAPVVSTVSHTTTVPVAPHVAMPMAPISPMIAPPAPVFARKREGGNATPPTIATFAPSAKEVTLKQGKTSLDAFEVISYSPELQENPFNIPMFQEAHTNYAQAVGWNPHISTELAFACLVSVPDSLSNLRLIERDPDNKTMFRITDSARCYCNGQKCVEHTLRR